MIVDPRRTTQLQRLVEKLGIAQTADIRWDLLHLALTHPTVSAEANYERLEFVGDAVIRLTAAEFLFETYPHASEGLLSAIRGMLVSDRLLARIARSYGLDRYLLLSDSAMGDKVGQETRLAAAFEALLAALYLSTHNLTLVRPWLDSHLQELAETIRLDPAFQNYKGALQAWTQTQYQTLPEYRVTEIGHIHGDRERFAAEVWIQGKLCGQGKGQSKKAAEQAAAQVAFAQVSGPASDPDSGPAQIPLKPSS
jgi:ribonuclease III